MARAILRIRSVQLVGPFSLRLGFSDGTSRRVNLQSELTGPVFEPLRDPEVFSRVVLDPVAGTVVWPNGADFAPEFLRGLPRERTKPTTKARRSGRPAARR